MELTFGARLKKQREELQIPLTTIAERTKISFALLEGLERDDLSRWPRGLFRRSYIRDYAQAIGFNPDTLLREFLELYPDPEEEITEALAKVRLGDTVYRPPTRLRSLIDSAVNKALPALRLQPTQASKAVAERPMYAPQGHRPATPAVPSGRQAILPAQPADAAPPPAHVAPAAIDQPEVDFAVVARLCTRLACAAAVDEVTALLAEVATELNTVGLSLWVRDPLDLGLTPVFASGYTDDTIAQLPLVSREADNAIAMSFRMADTQIVEGTDVATGALVVPLLCAAGCTGVLALEFRLGLEQRQPVRAAATLVAAQLSALLGEQVLAAAVSA